MMKKNEAEIEPWREFRQQKTEKTKQKMFYSISRGIMMEESH